MSTEHDARPAAEELVHLSESEWHVLQPLDRVRVKRPGESSDTGSVDQVMAGAAVFWVWLDDGKGRILVHQDDGRTAVWRLL
jgi:hypothetical protein